MKKWLLVFPCFCIGWMAAFTQADVPVPFRKGKRWGFADQERNILIAPRFEEVTPFSNIAPDFYMTAVPYATARAGDSCWLFGVNGQYQSFISGKNGSLNRMTPNLWVFKSEDGDFLLDSLLRVVAYFEDLRLPVRIPSFPAKTLFRKSYDWGAQEHEPYPDCPFLSGVLPMDVNWWNRPEYNNVFPVEHRRAHFASLMDANGNLLLPTRYRFVSNVYHGAVATDSGLVHLNGPTIYLPNMELEPKIAETGLVQFRTTDLQNRLIGFCNTEGTVVIPPQFLEAYGFYKGFAFCQDTARRWLLIDTLGETRFTLDTLTDVRWNPDYLFIHGQDGKWRAYDWALQLRSTIASDRIWTATVFAGREGYFGYTDQKVFLCDHDFNVLLQPEYETVNCVENLSGNNITRNYLYGRFLARKGKAYRLIDRNFSPASGWFYREGMNVYFSGGMQSVSIDGKWQVIDTSGQIASGFVYDTALYKYPPLTTFLSQPQEPFPEVNEQHHEVESPGVIIGWEQYAIEQTIPGYWLTVLPEEQLDTDSDVITIQSKPNSYFRDDGQCLIPAQDKQVIFFDRKDRCLIVYRESTDKSAIFDLKGQLITKAKYTQIWADPILPEGFVWVQVRGKSYNLSTGRHGLLRVRDGVEFFEK